jgi:hypothetical protein
VLLIAGNFKVQGDATSSAKIEKHRWQDRIDSLEYNKYHGAYRIETSAKN